MRKATAGGVICLAASLTFAATVLLAQSQPGKNAHITPLNLKTGLWQTTMTGKYSDKMFLRDRAEIHFDGYRRGSEGLRRG